MEGSSRVCERCRCRIDQGRVIKVKDQAFHEDCFKCSSCFSGLLTEFYKGPKGPVCRPCAVKLVAAQRSSAKPARDTTCSRCLTVISPHQIRVAAGEDKYHKECFTCKNCGCYLGTSFFPKDGDIYCKEHIKELLSAEAATPGSGRSHSMRQSSPSMIRTPNKPDADPRSPLSKTSATSTTTERPTSMIRSRDSAPLSSSADSRLSEHNLADKLKAQHAKTPKAVHRNPARAKAEENASKTEFLGKLRRGSSAGELMDKQGSAPSSPRRTPLSIWLAQQELKKLAFLASDVSHSGLINSSCADKGWALELGSHLAPDYHRSKEMHIEAMYMFYSEEMAAARHKVYTLIGHKDPILLAVESEVARKDKGHNFYRAMIFSGSGDERFLVVVKAGGSSQDRSEALRRSHPLLNVDSPIMRIEDLGVVEALKSYEQKMSNSKFKFGVIVQKPGQSTEDEWFNNVDSPPELLNFLDMLANRVELQSHDGFSGGLSKKDDSTGKYSYYTKFRSFEIMFHVSTLLPSSTADTQQVRRKRYIGNDVVVIIFRTYDTVPSTHVPFDPNEIHSHFNHVFVVVEPVRGTDQYKVAVVTKPGVKPSKPFVPSPAVFKSGADFRMFLLTKLINAELGGLKAQEFLMSLRRTRRELLENLVADHSPKAFKSRRPTFM